MKIHYPPEAEDAVSFIDRVFDKAVEATRTVKMLALGLHACAEQLGHVAEAVAVLAHNQRVHHGVMQQMWQMQQVIFKKLNENSMNMEMPDIETPVIDTKDTTAVEAAKLRKQAGEKPN